MAVEIFHRVGKQLRFTAIGQELLRRPAWSPGRSTGSGDLALFRQGYGPIVRLERRLWLRGLCRTSPSYQTATRFAIEILRQSSHP
jgi:hypothetical protein